MHVRSALLIAVLTIATTLACSSARNNQTLVWNEYEGTMTTQTNPYHVEIMEDDKGRGFSRIVHLNPIGMPGYVGMTGHDYNGDGKWDVLFYCGRPNTMVDSTNSGCNSVSKGIFGWNFQPCAADEGRAKPFSPEAIAFAIAELDSAMKVIYNDQNVRLKWVWDSAADSGKYIFVRGE